LILDKSIKKKNMGTTTAMSARSLQYYVIAKRWTTELEFFGLEIPFLYFLMDEYFMRLCEPACIKKFKQVITDLSKLETDRKNIKSLLGQQLSEITRMAEDIVPENIDLLSEKQIKIEYLFNALTIQYRAVKKELFALTDSFRKSKSN
jgi:hypothetical protein